MCRLMCVCVCVCDKCISLTPSSKARGGYQVSSLSLFMYSFEAQSLSEFVAPILESLEARKPQQSSCLHFPSNLGFQALVGMSSLLYVSWALNSSPRMTGPSVLIGSAIISTVLGFFKNAIVWFMDFGPFPSDQKGLVFKRIHKYLSEGAPVTLLMAWIGSVLQEVHV